MPLYLCASPNETIAQDKKQRISQAITDVHCDVTGAPPEFVHVYFFEAEQMRNLEPLTGGASIDEGYLLFGNIRSGRTDQVKLALVSGMRQKVAELLAVSLSEVHMLTRDIDAKWVMEGGDLLPEPGEEAAWLEKHKQRIAAEKA